MFNRFFLPLCCINNCLNAVPLLTRVSSGFLVRDFFYQWWLVGKLQRNEKVKYCSMNIISPPTTLTTTSTTSMENILTYWNWEGKSSSQRNPFISWTAPSLWSLYVADNCINHRCNTPAESHILQITTEKVPRCKHSLCFISTRSR